MRRVGQLGLLTMVLCTAIGLTFFVNSLIKSQSEKAERKAALDCIHTMGVIWGAQSSWAQALNKSTNEVATASELEPFLIKAMYRSGGKFPSCRKGGAYTIGRVNDEPKCSIPLHSLDLGSTQISVRNESDDWLRDAVVIITDEAGNRYKTTSHGDGWTDDVETWPHKPVLIRASKKGYVSVTNTCTMLWENKGVIRLQKETQ
jgi:hypothetical protein